MSTMTVYRDEAKHPILSALIEAGTIRVDWGLTEYIGTASDGTEVSIGSTYRADVAEQYLTDHPTPDTW